MRPATETLVDGTASPPKAPPQDNEPVSIVVVDSVAGLEQHIAAWDDLAGAAIEPNVFYESWMLLPALRHLALEERVQFLLVFVREPHQNRGLPRLCGLFPLVRRRSYRGLPVSVVTTWRHIHCYLGVPLVRTGHAATCFHAVLDWARTDRRGAALVEWSDLTGDGPFWQQLLEALEQRRTVPQITSCHTRALLRPGSGGQRYIDAVLSGDRRKKLRKAGTQLGRTGSVEYRELQEGDDLDAWLDDFLRLEATGWKGQQGTALNCSAADRTFFREVAHAAFARRRLMLLGLFCSGRPVALLCNLHAGDGSFAFKVAYDDAFAKYSPGALLELENIRRVHDRPQLRWMDSCTAPGPALVKSLWAERRVIQTVLTVTGRRGTAFLLALLPLLRWCRRSLGAFAGRICGLFRRFRREDSSNRQLPVDPARPLARE